MPRGGTGFMILGDSEGGGCQAQGDKGLWNERGAGGMGEGQIQKLERFLKIERFLN